MNASQIEAVEVADAHTSNAALPTYTNLLDALMRLSLAYEESTEMPAGGVTNKELVGAWGFAREVIQVATAVKN